MHHITKIQNLYNENKNFTYHSFALKCSGKTVQQYSTDINTTNDRPTFLCSGFFHCYCFAAFCSFLWWHFSDLLVRVYAMPKVIFYHINKVTDWTQPLCVQQDFASDIISFQQITFIPAHFNPNWNSCHVIFHSIPTPANAAVQVKIIQEIYNKGNKVVYLRSGGLVWFKLPDSVIQYYNSETFASIKNR